MEWNNALNIKDLCLTFASASMIIDSKCHISSVHDHICRNIYLIAAKTRENSYSLTPRWCFSWETIQCSVFSIHCSKKYISPQHNSKKISISSLYKPHGPSILTVSLLSALTSIIPLSRAWQSGGIKWGMWNTPLFTFSRSCRRLSWSKGKAPWEGMGDKKKKG